MVTRRQAIISTNSNLSSIWPSGINLNLNQSTKLFIHTHEFENVFAKWRPFCPGDIKDMADIEYHFHIGIKHRKLVSHCPASFAMSDAEISENWP